MRALTHNLGSTLSQYHTKILKDDWAINSRAFESSKSLLETNKWDNRIEDEKHLYVKSILSIKRYFQERTHPIKARYVEMWCGLPKKASIYISIYKNILFFYNEIIFCKIIMIR